MKKAKRERPKTYEVEHKGRKVRVTVPDDTADLAERIKHHPMNTASDLAYLRGKGYSDAEILAFWDRDHAQGQRPVHHGEAVAALTTFLKANLSPEAVAALANAVRVQINGGLKDRAVRRQLKWFAEHLVEMLGDEDAYRRACREAGL